MTNKREMAKKVRLESLTTAYCLAENNKEKYFNDKCAEKDYSSTTIQTLYIMQEHIDHLVKEIVKTVDWFIRNDLDHNNEVATLVYNYFAPQIRRGLSNLITTQKED